MSENFYLNGKEVYNDYNVSRNITIDMMETWVGSPIEFVSWTNDEDGVYFEYSEDRAKYNAETGKWEFWDYWSATVAVVDGKAYESDYRGNLTYNKYLNDILHENGVL